MLAANIGQGGTMVSRDPDRRAVLTAGAVAAMGFHGAAQAATAPIANTKFGRVQGAVDQGVLVFKGIRYGADTAAYRFQPPRWPTPWKDVFAAEKFGPASPQPKIDEPTSEDCLVLNIWTPALRDGKKRAVMLYVHGGAHTSGSGSDPQYDGVRLVHRGDVVVVSLNHRLNLFGYLYLGRFKRPDLADSGNVGNLDLIQALQWVRDNIAEFGGDPGNVMLFGQSGGGGKLVTLMAMDRAQGLYHRVATMSGQHVTVMGPNHATTRARALVKACGLTPERVDELRTLPKERLVEAFHTPDPLEGGSELTLWSVLDERSTTRHPFYPGAPAISAHIPMIIGNVHDEARYFLKGDKHNFELSWDEVPDKLVGQMVADLVPEYVVARYRQMYPNYSPSDVFFGACTAGRSWRGHLIQAEERAKTQPAWMYQLNYKSPAEGGKFGAFHTLDIPLVFDNNDKPGSLAGTDKDGLKVADTMCETFIAFAKTGDPNNARIPFWKKYDLKDRATMIFDVQSRMENDPRRGERELIETVPYLKPGT
jgi:para-nitrobenzyl esterase